MQKSWRQDHNKLTFIVCRPYTQPGRGTSALSPADIICGLHPGGRDKPDYMIGDVNLFLHKDFEVDENGDDTDKTYLKGEIELMIAIPEYRGKGLGKATLLAFLRYITEKEAQIIKTFIEGEVASGNGTPDLGDHIRLGVKIGEDNERSRKLFGSVGFEQVGEPNYFKEVELQLLDRKLLDWEKIPSVEASKMVWYAEVVPNSADKRKQDEGVDPACMPPA